MALGSETRSLCTVRGGWCPETCTVRDPVLREGRGGKTDSGLDRGVDERPGLHVEEEELEVDVPDVTSPGRGLGCGGPRVG